MMPMTEHSVHQRWVISPVLLKTVPKTGKKISHEEIDT